MTEHFIPTPEQADGVLGIPRGSGGRPPTPEVDPLIVALVARRRELGLTQQRLAADIGAAQSHICEMEKGYRSPPPPLLARWTQRLGVRNAVVEPVAGDEGEATREMLDVGGRLKTEA